MKVSLNWIKEYLDFELPPLAELVAKIGAQLGEVSEVVDVGAKYRGSVIVRVQRIHKLEDSDHLNVCFIDDGKVVADVERETDGLVQVVCGAPNVREGMLVAWLPPGTTVPSSFDEAEPFVLSARPLRGVVSNGMLASAKELAIGDSHEGLLELDGDHQPGADFAKAYGLDDTIIDIENKMFTHRPDCFGQLGVAREIAGIVGHQFTSPDWYLQPTIPEPSDQPDLKVSVVNEIPELVPRYMLATVADVVVSPSPIWLQAYLSRLGVRPINNIVDVTNYMMLLTGQPLHAFDFDKVAAGGQAHIVVRNPHVGESVTLLDGKTVKPRADAILICDASKPIGLGGVMGGNNSEIGDGTTRILIESASFDMFNIRRTSMEHGIFSEAVTRFTKGQSEWQCPAVLYQAVQMINGLCSSAQLVGQVIDQHQPRRDTVPVPVATSFINDRLGVELTPEAMQPLLEHVEFAVSSSDAILKVTAPFWRTDIELREDVVEEVGRLYGFDHLPTLLPRREISPAPKDQMMELKSEVRRLLAKAGANEALTYSFVHGNLLDKAAQDTALAYRVSNALSPDLQYYRLTLMPSLLEKVHPNIKAGYDKFVLFEIGKGHNTKYQDESGLPVEFEMLEAVFAAQPKVAPAGASFYQARKYLVDILAELGIAVSFRPLPEASTFSTVQPFDPSRTALVYVQGTDKLLGGIGEFKASVKKAFKLPQAAAGFNISLTDLQQAIQADTTPRYRSIPRFPKVTQDITLKVPTELPYQTLYDFVWAELTKLQPQQTMPVLQPVAIYQSEDDTAHKNISLRLSIASYERTLTDTEVSRLLGQLAEAALTELAAERV